MRFGEGDMGRFREDGCSAIYALIADALYRCTTQDGATWINVEICSLSPFCMPSRSSMYLLSVTDFGPGIKYKELQNYFPFFSKPSYSTLSTEYGLRWSGIVRLLTAGAGDEESRRYEIRVESYNRPDIIQLPCVEYDKERVSGTVSEITVEGDVEELVHFARSLCEKTSMLKLKYLPRRGNTSQKGLHICEMRRDLEEYQAADLLCIGAVEYLSSYRCGFSAGSTMDMRFRELVKVGKGQAGSIKTKWILDACVVLIDLAMASEIFANIDPQISLVNYFEDGCYTPVPESVQTGLTTVDWSMFGLKLQELQISDWGEVFIRFQEPTGISAVFIVLHIHQNSRSRQRSYWLGGARLVKAAVEASLLDLKARFSSLFWSEHAIEMRQVAHDVSECIAKLITSSTNESFREECASIVGLPFQNLEEMEDIIRTKMFEIIQMNDGHPKRKPEEDSIECAAVDLDEDDNESYFDDEEQEILKAVSFSNP